MISIVDNIYRANSRRAHIEKDYRARDVISFRKELGRKNSEGKLGVIAEFKRSSPSGFSNTMNSSLKEYLKRVSKFGICGLSILTEPDYFNGSMEDVMISQRLNMPILVKDFISNRRMIDDAYKAGGDVVLLIADFLNREDIIDMVRYTIDLGMEALLEFHDLKQLDKITVAENAIIGYNRRNLRTMKMEPQEEKVLKMIEGLSVPLILESGINSSNLNIIENTRFNGLLIGTSILNNDNVLKKMQEMRVI